MLESTADYLKALQDGNYLLFLNWTKFVLATHKQNHATGESTTDLVALEWLQAGFRIEDAKRFAIVYATTECADSLLNRGYIAYSLLTIHSTTLKCMAYTALKLPKPNSVEFLNQQIANNGLFVDTYKQMETEFHAWPVDSTQVSAANIKINTILLLTNEAEKYRSLLTSLELSHDNLRNARMSLSCQLIRYLENTYEMSPDVTKEVANFVSRIRAMQPHPIELESLNKLSPPTVIESSLQWVSKTVIGFFFSVMQPQTNHQNAIATSSNEPPQKRG